MCVGALGHARVSTLVYGAPEPKTGAIESAARPSGAVRLEMTVVSGVLMRECRDRMQGFFEGRR
jgi:tRNA(adenine34) deaminase